MILHIHALTWIYIEAIVALYRGRFIDDGYVQKTLLNVKEHTKGCWILQ